ncbi:hypothetical protein XH81_16440 [Bradyrhizobium sp. CCBAU 25360]|uniref:hypothetical protein n=1 Tax=Bradyrhizobium sp. CCBAU 25360 TaxID=858425 RepID=UPI002305C050|nr:hypothetical protein [Bradyrhizobium sp. CCBAU 25360]MDA9416426.1 hypothetical protein [Bradyrhizobium sp. CCBAU 25360]
MSENDNWYPERPPQFADAGDFEAVIFGSDRPLTNGAKGYSYAAFAIRRKGDHEYHYGVASSRGDSEEYRGYIAAIVAVTEALPAKSSAIVTTHNKTLATIFKEWLPGWEANGWKKADKKPPAAVEILQRYWAVKRERQLNLAFEHVARNDWRFGGVFNRLSGTIQRFVEKQFPERP